MAGKGYHFGEWHLREEFFASQSGESIARYLLPVSFYDIYSFLSSGQKFVAVAFLQASLTCHFSRRSLSTKSHVNARGRRTAGISLNENAAWCMT